MGNGREAVALLNARTTALWVLGVALFGVGDVATTATGFALGNVIEAGPFVAPVIRSYGLGAMIPLKAAAIGICYGLWRAAPSPHDVGVPLGLATLGALVTGWNTVVLLLAAGAVP